MAGLLAERGIVCEFADPDCCVFMFSPANPASDLDTLAAALRTLSVPPSIETQPPKLGVPERVLPPREAMLAPFETLPREQALGRVLAAPTVSCPPAVPILVCGERIDAQALALFAYYGLDWLDVVLPDFEQGGMSR